MRLIAISVGAAALVILLNANVAAQIAAPGPAHDQAVEAIRKLGGEVNVDTSGPGAPVAVTLTGSADPGKCVTFLKGVRNLQKCDL